VFVNKCAKACHIKVHKEVFFNYILSYFSMNKNPFQEHSIPENIEDRRKSCALLNKKESKDTLQIVFVVLSL
jgi:hypothetical protein